MTMKRTGPVLVLCSFVLLLSSPVTAEENGVAITFGDPVQFSPDSTLAGSAWLRMEFGPTDTVQLDVLLPAGSAYEKQTERRVVLDDDVVGGVIVPVALPPETHDITEEVQATFTWGGDRGSLWIEAETIHVTGGGGLVAAPAGSCAWDVGHRDSQWLDTAPLAPPCMRTDGVMASLSGGTIRIVVDGLSEMQWRGADVACDGGTWCPDGAQADDAGSKAGIGSAVAVQDRTFARWHGSGGSLSGGSTASFAFLGSPSLDLTASDWLRLPAVEAQACKACRAPGGEDVTIKGVTLLSGIKRGEDGRLLGAAYSKDGRVFFNEQPTDWLALRGWPAAVAVTAAVGAVSALLAAKILAPLLTRGSADEMLRHPRRASIYAYIQENPGTTFRELSRNTEIPGGSLRHHLNVLQRSDIVVEHDHLATKRYFENHGKFDESWHEVVMLREEPLADLHAWLRRNPDGTQKALLAAMGAQGWSRSTTQHRLGRLVSSGLVRETPRGRCKTYRVRSPPVPTGRRRHHNPFPT